MMSHCTLGDRYLLERYYFSSRLFELFQLTQKVPKSRFGHYSIRSKYSHFIKRSCLLLFGRELSPYHFIFLQLKEKWKTTLFSNSVCIFIMSIVTMYICRLCRAEYLDLNLHFLFFQINIRFFGQEKNSLQHQYLFVPYVKFVKITHIPFGLHRNTWFRTSRVRDRKARPEKDDPTAILLHKPIFTPLVLIGQ